MKSKKGVVIAVIIVLLVLTAGLVYLSVNNISLNFLKEQRQEKVSQPQIALVVEGNNNTPGGEGG